MIFRIAVEVQTMEADDLTKGLAYVDDEQEGTKYRALGYALVDWYK